MLTSSLIFNKEIAMSNLISFQEVKNEWETTHYLQDAKVSLEQFINDNYTPVYSESLDFIGFSKGSIYHKN
jgi:hypothetical protein